MFSTLERAVAAVVSRKRSKNSAEGGDDFAILPRAARKYEVEQVAGFAGALAFQQRLSNASKFENPHALGPAEIVRATRS